jgi:hypothetical protein
MLPLDAGGSPLTPRFAHDGCVWDTGAHQFSCALAIVGEQHIT